MDCLRLQSVSKLISVYLKGLIKKGSFLSNTNVESPESISKWIIDTSGRPKEEEINGNDELSQSACDDDDDDDNSSSWSFNQSDIDQYNFESQTTNATSSTYDNSFAHKCGTGERHITDDKMRTNAINIGIQMLFTCKNNCPSGQNCHALISSKMSSDLRNRLWNNHRIQEPPPKSKERRQRIVELVGESYVKQTNTFAFSIPNEILQTNVPVCEGTVYIISLKIPLFDIKL